MNRGFAIWCLSLAVFFSACSNSPFPEFSQLGGKDLYFKLHVLGDGQASVEPDEVIKVRMDYRTLNGQLLSSTRWQQDKPWYAVQYRDLGSNLLGEGLMSLVAGDSATFLLPRAAVQLDTVAPNIVDTGQYLVVDVFVEQILSQRSYEIELKRARELAELKRMEPVELAKCLEMAGLADSNYVGGLYFQMLEPGEGPLAQTGDVVTIHYEGFFAHNERFDSSIERQEPLEFELGIPDQVILGFEVALRKMRPGSKAKIVLPSQLAFGARGSSTGIVQPYTPVVYDLELLNVQIPSNTDT